MKNKRKFSWKIFGAICVVIIAAIAGTLYWRRNDVAALNYYLQNSKEELEDKITENNKKVVEAMEKLPFQTIKDLTDEEKEKLASNEITEEEALQIILNKSTPAPQSVPPSQSVSAASAKTSEPSPTIDESEERIAAIIAEIYVLRARYTNSLEEMRMSAIGEYHALPEAQRTNAAKQTIGVKYLKMAGALESECDAKMDDVVRRLQNELKDSGGDISIIDDVKFTYANEKSLKKAYYLNMYR
jgi:uncharacterized protein YxeA